MRALWLTVAVFLIAIPMESSALRSENRCVLAHPPEHTGHLLAEFKTDFGAGNHRRSNNVRLAAQQLDGVVLRPNARLSYNEQVGPRTQEAGFREANVILRGQMERKLGGGVCQPSSTLYAAALLGGFRILERKPHTWRSKYIAPGFDATVAWGQKDLVIRNPFPFAVRIEMEVGESHITARLLGAEAPETWHEVMTSLVRKTEFETLIETDPSLRTDQIWIMNAGIPGGRFSRQRIQYNSERRIRTEQLSDDIYRPRHSLVRIGPDLDS